MIPLIDLTLTKSVEKRIKKSVDKVIDSKTYVLGSQLELFEKKFAKYIGARFAIGVGNGTDALRLCLRALEIGKGDSVLTVAFTSPFTAISIIEEGAVPIFCDIDPKTLTIDLESARQKIDKKTKAIIPVHIYGNPCNMQDINRFARKYKLKIIEDACQAHGAKYQNKMVGTFGHAAAFSFYPTKNLGAMGDAGATTTNDITLAKKMSALRHGGQTKRFWHEFRGINSRLDEIQAAVLNIKLDYLETWNRQRQYLAERYKREFQDLPISFQTITESSTPVYHLFIIRTVLKNKLKDFLMQQGISSDIYYPHPIHLQNAFHKFQLGELPATEQISKEILAIPISPTLSLKSQDKIISVIRKFY